MADPASIDRAHGGVTGAGTDPAAHPATNPAADPGTKSAAADSAQLGPTLRRYRRGRGWTLRRLADAAGCSVAYLSEIENARHANPPSGRLIGAIEGALELEPDALRRLADWQATPPGVKADYERLARQLSRAGRREDGSTNLDALYRAGALHRRAEAVDGNLDSARIPLGPGVPLINKVAAGYPTDFTDLDYPARVADEYVACPGISDPDAFAARVVGQSMHPEYDPGDILIFSPRQAPADGSDCFARLLPDHHSTFKRVFFEAEDRVRLQPLNPAFSPQILPMEQIAGLYPAVFRMQAIGR